MKKLIVIIFFALSFSVLAQHRITAEKIPTDEDLLFSLKAEIPELQKVYEERDKRNIEKAKSLLIDYFKEKFSERYFFSWKNFKNLFSEYSKKYPNEKAPHIRRADEHSSLFPASAQWELPSKNFSGGNVSAYELRHLARQHKSINAAFAFYYENENSERIKYFIEQVRSLNDAFTKNKYDDKGNAVYEVFHAGYRVQNWLFVHALYLASTKYLPSEQIDLIRTLLHNGAQIAKRGKKFNYGNHHTKGMTALFLLSTIFPEFQVSDEWRKLSIEMLLLHLQREVNEDGFQFERSVHYHMGDIDNYFYVYQLAEINNIALPEEFKKRFRSMFDALVKMAQPNKKLPVLQDDTDAPWGEFNEIRNSMTIGALLFKDPVYRYFASESTGAELSWFVSQSQEEFLKKKGRKPIYESLSLEQTGYYVMRDGWEEDNRHLIISAGLSKQKPDHQHGDMLGIVAFANGNQILPNYQVRYNLPDYELFKNSFVKNVAIVDSIPQGRDWKKNEGESGFGKWNFIPTPNTLAWYSDENIDYYCGTHNGYDQIGVKYLREVFFIKNGFWIVQDKFFSSNTHNYYQIWQGHYDFEKQNTHLRSTFQNGSGLDIVLLNQRADRVYKNSTRGKGSVQLVVDQKKDYVFETLLYPFKNFETCIMNVEDPIIPLSNWKLIKIRDNRKMIDSSFSFISKSTGYFTSGNKFLLTNISELKIKSYHLKFVNPVNVFLIHSANKFYLQFMIGERTEATINMINGVFLNNKQLDNNLMIIEPKNSLTLQIN